MTRLPFYTGAQEEPQEMEKMSPTKNSKPILGDTHIFEGLGWWEKGFPFMAAVRVYFKVSKRMYNLASLVDKDDDWNTNILA